MIYNKELYSAVQQASYIKMQSLDEFKVRNFTKRVLRVQRERQEDQIYAFTQNQEIVPDQRDGSDGEERASDSEEEEAKALLDSREQ